MEGASVAAMEGVASVEVASVAAMEGAADIADTDRSLMNATCHKKKST
jgi:predicted solute-binding protein